MYEDAERCLSYFSAKDPDRKRKLATIYYGKGQYEEAYKTLEAEVLANYQTMSVMLLEIFMVAVKTENLEKAQVIIEKESALADLFEMGRKIRVSRCFKRFKRDIKTTGLPFINH